MYIYSVALCAFSAAMSDNVELCTCVRRENEGVGLNKRPYTQRGTCQTVGLITTKGRTHKEGAAKQWVWLQEKRPNIQTGRWNRRLGPKKRSCTQRETGRTVGLLQPQAVHTMRERPNSGFGYKKNGQTYKREGGTEGLASTKGHAHKERQAEQWGYYNHRPYTQ